MKYQINKYLILIIRDWHSLAIRCIRCMLLTATLAFSSLTAANEKGTWFFSIDNDAFAGSDDDYTNGLQVGWVSSYLDDYSDGPVFSALGDRLGELGFLSGSDRQRFISYSVSHRIFTPGDTETTELIENDLPYSGLLFATATFGAQDAKRMDALSFHFGITGPSAQGEQVQNEFHKLIGSDRVNGWDNQINDEFLFNVNYERRWRIKSFRFDNGMNGDILGQAGAAVGNLISMATLGVGGRIGWGVSDDFAIPPQFFGEETIGSRPYSPSNNQKGFWFFALLNGSVFGNAIFWDGNTFEDSPSVDYSRAIGRLYLGTVYKKPSYALTFAVAMTTVPWDNPDDKTTQRYGRLGITYNF